MRKTPLVLILLFAIHFVSGQTIEVLTYNIKYDNPKDSLNNWDSRKDFLISQLRFYSPDIFGTQEGLVHQLKDIEQGLDNYAFFGVGRDYGDERGEFTAIFYDQTKFDVLKEATFWLSTTPEEPSKSWDAALPRICTYGHFKLKKSGEEFFVFNTHFDHVGKVARKESAKLILKKIKELNTKRLPVVLMGDFNLENSSGGIQWILKEMQDAHAEAGQNAHGPEGTFNGFNFTKPVNRRIDYIFVDGFETSKSGILSDSFDCRYPSDHFPVYAELYFEK
ncbi:endonuclease/exonuclease/phosphatase family protein [Allomuricauda sp. d1]|uniref:endonuclease/exonuclease/phosphatase family protein n=1 Tax=Allomuricauda sp. d1 TaxID=3136725 RepID=UPI0031E13CAF